MIFPATARDNRRRMPRPRWAVATMVVVATVTSALAGLVVSVEGRTAGKVALQPDHLRVGNKQIKWTDVLVAVNDPAPPVAAMPNAVYLKSGEVWTGTVSEMTTGKITFESATLGKHTLKAEEVLAIDFASGLDSPAGSKGRMLHRAKGKPVSGDLVWIKADKAAVDTAVGAVALARTTLTRYVFADVPERFAAPTSDQVLLSDGSLLHGKVQPAGDGAVVTHAVLGRKQLSAAAWRMIRRYRADVVYLSDVPPTDVKTTYLIRRPADPPTVARFGHDEAGPYAGRLHVHPKTVATWKLPAEAKVKRTFRTSISLAAGSLGDAVVKFRLGERAVFEKTLTPDEPRQDVTFMIEGPAEMVLDVDFGQTVRLPCSVVLDDACLLQAKP